MSSFWVAVVAVFIPPLTALVTRWRAGSEPNVHRLVAVVLTVGLDVAAALTDDRPDDFKTLFVRGLTILVAQVAAYKAVWEGARVNERMAPSKGI